MIGPIPYIGGKNRLASTIIPLIPEHTTFVEPFAGGAQVFFHKQPSRVEVLNDIDGEVVNFYRVCQWHYEELVRLLESMPSSRKLHELQLKTDPSTLTDIQRAARFLFLQKTSFGGLIIGQNFHYGVTHPSNHNPSRLREILRAAHSRLQHVQLECLPYQDVLRRYDRGTTCFYIDPPYYNRRLYRHNLEHKDYVEMADVLKQLKGRFILSINDTPEVRQIFFSFDMDEVDLAYTAQSKPGRRYTELLIRNFASTTARSTEQGLVVKARRSSLTEQQIAVPPLRKRRETQRI